MISKDDLVAALQGLSPEQLASILSQGHGRSPIKSRQLHDLRLPPTATDPRPTFFQETDAREFHPITHKPFPALLWHVETGQEITVYSEADKQARGPMWTSLPPSSQPLDPVETMRQMFEALSEEDKAFVIETQRSQRQQAISAKMATMTPSQLAAALGDAPEPKKGKSK